MKTNINNGFGELPKNRGKNQLIFGFILFFIYVVGTAWYRFNSNAMNLLFDDTKLLCAVTSSVMFGHYGVRTVLLFTEERYHVNSRYSQSHKTAFQACISFSGMETMLLFAAGCFGTWKYWSESENVLFQWPVYILVALVSGIYPQHLSRAEVSQLNETVNKHVADGLAWSYYFGYLKLILPRFDGMISKAVKSEKFEIGGEDVRDVLSSQKLLIVVPKDCYCYNSFSDVDKRIAFKLSMPEQKRTRGAVQERIYKNTLYEVQVNPKKKPLYVMMEYATPVLSMFDMSKNARANFSSEDLSCQVQEFCKKLKEILDNDPECRNRYELVLTESAYRNLADVISDTVKSQNISL